MRRRETTPFSRIMGNTSIIIAGRILNAVCSFIFIPWTVQSIGLTAFGQFLLVTAYVILVSDITHLQSWQPLLHYGSAPFRAGEERKFHTVLAFCIRADFLSGFVGMVVGLAGIALFGTLLGWPPSLRPLAACCALTILFMNTGWSVGVMRLLNMFRLSTMVECTGTCVRTLGCFIGYYYHLSMGYFLAVWSMTQLALFICYTGAGLVLIHRAMRTPFPWKELFLPSERIHGIWRFTLGTSVSQILDSCFKQASTLLVGASLGAADAAIFRVANQITSALARPATLLIPSLYPEFIRLRDSEDWPAFRRTVLHIMRTIGLVSVVALVVSFTLGEHILTYMLHHPCPGGAMIMGILTISALLDIAITPLEPLLTVLGNVSYVLRAKGVALVLYAPALAGLTYAMGVNGSAIASVLASSIMFILCARKAARVFAHTRALARQTTPNPTPPTA